VPQPGVRNAPGEALHARRVRAGAGAQTGRKGAVRQRPWRVSAREGRCGDSLVKLVGDGFPRVARVIELDHTRAVAARDLRAASSALRGQRRPHSAAYTHRLVRSGGHGRGREKTHGVRRPEVSLQSLLCRALDAPRLLISPTLDPPPTPSLLYALAVVVQLSKN
jgi:hypothetical protein